MSLLSAGNFATFQSFVGLSVSCLKFRQMCACLIMRADRTARDKGLHRFTIYVYAYMRTCDMLYQTLNISR